ncbi:penicillin acylase family protein, partial [Georgenia sp. 10Sc9-8]|nr:penicillin acylase family protein [Georgenia halotolerans]
KAMAWDLRSNYDAELGRAAALRPLAGDVARVEELYPGYPYAQHPPVLTPQENGTATPPDGSGAGADAGPDDAPAETGDAGADDASGETDAEGETTAAPGWLDREATNALASAHEAIQAVPVLLGEGEGVGSNSFVVAGEHTASGAPLLANDPHLSISAPGVWYQVGLHCTETSAECTFDVAGFSFAGMPGVIIGHNSDLSWGLTNLNADVTDFFLERVYDDGTHLYDGERVDLSRRTETIEVNGGSDLVLTITSTRHGPIISEVLPETSAAGSVPVPQDSPSSGFSGYAVALGWTALQPGRTAEAIFAMNRATDAADLAAAAAILDVPAQNIVFATTDGAIGYQAPGRVPVRRPVPEGPLPSDGTWPRPGWDPRYDWKGFVAPEDMPAAVDPAEGFIVAANQAVAPAGEGPFLARDWDYGYRADRIRALIESSIADDPLDAEAMNAIMLDDHSPYAPVLVPALLQVDVDDPFVQEAVDLLRQWSADGFPQSRDSAAAAYFAAIWANLLELTFSDELPASQAPDGGSRWLHVVRGLLEDPENPWWDDRTTVDQVEGRDLILQRSLVRARRQLTNFLGKDADRWEWGKVHDAELRHPVLGGESLPVPLTTLMNPAAVGVSGGPSIVNAMSWDAGARTRDGRPVFTVTSAPSMRMVSDLSDLDASRWVNLTGSSGHAGSAHYTDQIDAWADGRTFPWPFSRAAAEEAAADELTLRPPA